MTRLGRFSDYGTTLSRARSGVAALTGALLLATASGYAQPTTSPVTVRSRPWRVFVEAGTDSGGWGYRPSNTTLHQGAAWAWTLRVGGRVRFLNYFEGLVRVGVTFPFQFAFEPTAFCPPVSQGWQTMGSSITGITGGYRFIVEAEARLYPAREWFYLGAVGRLDMLHVPEVPTTQGICVEIPPSGFVQERTITFSLPSELRVQPMGGFSLGAVVGPGRRFDLHLAALFGEKAMVFAATLAFAVY